MSDVGNFVVWHTGTYMHMYRYATAQNFLHHSFRIHAPVTMEQTECTETSAIKLHTPENNPKGYTRYTEHGESLKSRIAVPIYVFVFFYVFISYAGFVIGICFVQQ
jgi:hypothetical protein